METREHRALKLALVAGIVVGVISLHATDALWFGWRLLFR